MVFWQVDGYLETLLRQVSFSIANNSDLLVSAQDSFVLDGGRERLIIRLKTHSFELIVAKVAKGDSIAVFLVQLEVVAKRCTVQICTKGYISSPIPPTDSISGIKYFFSNAHQFT